MLKIPRVASRSFFSALRDDMRTLADAAGIPQNTAEILKAGLKVGVKVFACMIAAHELHTHASRLLGEAAGEVKVFEGDEFDEATKHIRETAYNVGMQNGACVVWLHASQLHGFPVPAWVLEDIKRLSDAGQWHQGHVVMEPALPAQRGDVREGQADELPAHTGGDCTDCPRCRQEQAAGDAG